MSSIAELFERLYGRPPAGERESALHHTEERLGVSMPPPLRSFYSACGREARVMSSYNRFLRPAALRLSDGRLVYCEENQTVCVWGSVPGDPDPLAEVANVLDDDELEWHSEEVTLSRFLEILLYLQTAWGGFRHVGRLPATKRARGKIEAEWEEVVRHNDLIIHAQPGALISKLEGEGFLTVATRTSAELARLERELGVVRQ